MARSSTCQHRAEDGSAGRLADALEPGSLLVLAVLRAWVSRLRAPHQPAPDWRALFGIAEVPAETATRFDTMMGHVRHGMRRALDIRCCACPRIGADEEAMLRLVAALQQDDRLSALDVLTDWLGPEAAMRALPAAEGFALALLDQRFTLAAAPAAASAMAVRPN